jgi:hypothetical protein
VLHHFHPARNSGTDPVQSQTRHRAENERKRGNHLWLYVKTIVKKPERYYDDGSGYNRLRNAQDDSDSKQRTAPRPIADSFRARDECGDRIVEPKNTDLADDVSG